MVQIQMYGTSWCPDCSRAKQIFRKHNVAYAWHDIEQDKQARLYVEKVNGGLQSVPTIVFPDGSILVEPTDAALEEKLSGEVGA